MKLNFSKLQKRFQPRTALALTIESGQTTVSALSEDGKVSQTLSLPIGAESICKDPQIAGEKLAAALDGANIRSRRCVICMPPGWALSASTDLPEVSAEDLHSYLELCAEREFPIPVSELRLAHSAYTMPDGKQRATLAAVPAKRLEAVEKMLETAKCRVASISLALSECLAKPEPALHFLANGTHTDVVITGGGGIVSMRSLTGLTHSDETPFDPASFYREIRITLGRLPEAFRQQMHSAHFGGTPSSAQRLCADTREQLSRFGINEVDCSPEENPEPQAVGAARDFLGGKPVVFEYFTPDVKQWQVMLQRVDSSRHRWVMAGAIGLVVLPLLAIFIRNQYENHLVNEWNGMQRKVNELDALQQKIHQFRPWFEPTPQVLQVMESVISAFPEQGDVWAKNLQVGEGYKVTCTGFARNQGALLALLERLRKNPNVISLQVQQMRGDNPVQFSFTCKWQHAQ